MIKYRYVLIMLNDHHNVLIGQKFNVQKQRILVQQTPLSKNRITYIMRSNVYK